MPPFVIRDPVRVRGQWVVTVVSLLLLGGYAVLRRFVGPPETVPLTMYLAIGALVLAWGVFSIRVRAIVLRIAADGITTPRKRFRWEDVTRVSAHAGELVVVAERRYAFPFPRELTEQVDAALVAHRPAARG